LRHVFAGPLMPARTRPGIGMEFRARVGRGTNLSGALAIAWIRVPPGFAIFREPHPAVRKSENRHLLFRVSKLVRQGQAFLSSLSAKLKW